jgi:hypothetical protein
MVKCLGFRPTECREGSFSGDRVTKHSTKPMSVDVAANEIAYLEPKELSISFSSQVWH